jgi:DNA polymerase I-like protein with 3'-5' exonuclease and polymerase domains
MMNSLNAGIDVHTQLGTRLAGVSYDDMVELLDADDPVMKMQRRIAKHANFAFMGGAAAKRYAAMVFSLSDGEIVLDLKEAAHVRALWKQTWREEKEYFDYINGCSDGHGFFDILQARVPRLRRGCTYTSAANTLFQGLASDGAKAALYEVAREQFTPGSLLWESRTVAFIHDEIIMETPEHLAHEASMRLQAVMEREFNKFVPDCPTQAEPTMMRFWSKAAKQVWDEGTLVPWEGAA